MKDFFKYLLATILGIVCVGVFTGIISFVMLMAVVVAGNAKPEVADGSVLRLRLTGTLSERATDDPMALFTGNTVMTEQGLDDMLAAIRVAKANPNIAGIYIEGGVLGADFASLEELRRAVVDFKKSGKFVLAYGDNYTQGAYYVASAADKVLLNPSGMLDWHGISSQPVFYKELLDKIGVRMQVFRVGTFKSAVEPYTLTEMSPANRAQVQSFIDDIWGNICKDVAASRRLKADSLDALADRYVTFSDAQSYVKMGLIDGLTYIDGVRTQLRALTGTDDLHMVEAHELATLDEPAGHDDKVAVYYAYGSIVDQSTASPFGGSAEIVGAKVVDDLDRLMNDDDVKAVVLRINSGGGSAYASELMWHAVQLLRQKKPVVVSMGGMAASGGYYMACGADCIYAEHTTLTGSIGIFGMVPDASGLLTEKLGLHFDVVKTNEAADFGALGRPFNERESASMQQYVNNGYRLFLNRVAAGRKMRVADVDSIAQGRVWTGAQAVKIKLVDKLGTLDEAVAEAARRAGVKRYDVTYAPAALSWVDQLMETATSDYMENRVRSALGAYYEPLMFIESLEGSNALQARIPFEPNLH